MILLVLRNTPENNALHEEFRKKHPLTRAVESIDNQILNELIAGQYSGLIVDCLAADLSASLTFQVLLGISNIVPSVYFNFASLMPRSSTTSKPLKGYFCLDDSSETIMDNFDALSARNISKAGPSPRVIPQFDASYASECLNSTSALCILVIDATNFKGIEGRFGRLAFEESRRFFQDLLMDLWGTTGSFRSKDVLCKHGDNTNLYIVQLESNRTLGRMPPPGTLEKIADRVQIQIDNELWKSLSSKQRVRGLPIGMTLIPDVYVGYAAATASLIEDDRSVIDHLINAAMKSTKLQERRLNVRRKEYMQNLICTPEALKPVYQGVFQLQGLTQSVVDEVKRSQSIAPLRPYFFGFESLIRAQKKVITDLLGSSQLLSLNPDLLVPDVMFSLAKSVDTALELDLVAMRQAIKFANGLPGKLMINILPRNFYNMSKLRKFLPHDLQIVFEVSESEAIENFDLVCEVRADLKVMNIGVATDDFGRDYGGLERIFKIQPDIIKLDRALIENIHLDPPRRAFLSGLVQSARISNAVTLAEGVECWEEAKALQEIGVELIQGYLLHRPQEVSLIHKQLQEEIRSSESPLAKVIPLKAS